MDHPNATPRYAIYYAPGQNTPLWQLASAWLGRDAFADHVVERPHIAGVETETMTALTKKAAHYGFHGTLTAPFELANSTSEDQLIESALEFATEQVAFDIGLEVNALGQFIALRPSAPCPEINLLHENTIQHFNSFRKPLSEADIARRRQSTLTPQQDKYMLEWGYPYIFDNFCFHLTLTNRIADGKLRESLVQKLSGYFSDVTSKPHIADGIALFKQPNRDTPFQVIKRFSFGG